MAAPINTRADANQALPHAVCLSPDARAFVTAWATLEREGLRTIDLSSLLQISGASLRRMKSGRKPVPPAVAMWVIRLADFLVSNPVPNRSSNHVRSAAPDAR